MAARNDAPRTEIFTIVVGIVVRPVRVAVVVATALGGVGPAGGVVVVSLGVRSGRHDAGCRDAGGGEEQRKRRVSQIDGDVRQECVEEGSQVESDGATCTTTHHRASAPHHS